MKHTHSSKTEKSDLQFKDIQSALSGRAEEKMKLAREKGKMRSLKVSTNGIVYIIAFSGGSTLIVCEKEWFNLLHLCLVHVLNSSLSSIYTIRCAL